MEGMEANRPRSDKLAEILLCILCAGLSSHKRSSLIQLSDCPEEFKENKQINFDKMEKELFSLPKVDEIRKALESDDDGKLALSNDQTKLLLWLHTLPYGRFENSNFSEFTKDFPLEARNIQKVKARPNYILKFIDNEVNEEQEKLFEEFGSMVGYHGSELSNFLSITRYGLKTKFIKIGQGLFGDGIYFSTDPLVAMNYVAYYPIPKKLENIIGGSIGNRIGCSVICQVAKHPEQVKFAKENTSKTYVGINGEPQIAKHYVLAKSPEYFKMRYLFIYTQYSAHRRNLFLLVVLIYIIIFVAIAMVKSKGWRRFFVRYT